MHLYYAKIIADDLVAQLHPYCDLINIAGSIRRKKDDVKDIEIVCIAKRVNHKETNLFGEVVKSITIVDPGFERVVKLGKVIKGKCSGRYMQIEIERQVEGFTHVINVDLFMPQAHDYYRQFAIRTGSAEYSRRFLAISWIKRGWCGTEYGLRKISESYKIDQTKWVMKPEFMNKPSLPPVWKDEEDFFRWLGVQYLPPEHRNL